MLEEESKIANGMVSKPSMPNSSETSEQIFSILQEFEPAEFLKRFKLKVDEILCHSTAREIKNNLDKINHKEYS